MATVMNIQFLLNAGNFTTYGGSTSFKLRTLLHGFSLVSWLVG